MHQVHVQRRVVGLSADEAFDRLSDFGKYPKYCSEVREVRVRELEPNVLQVDWEVKLRGGVVRWSETNRLNRREGAILFEQLQGDLKHFAGLWRVVACREGVELVFHAEFDLGMSLLGDMLSGVAKRALAQTSKRRSTASSPSSRPFPGVPPTRDPFPIPFNQQPNKLPQRRRAMNFLRREYDALDQHLPGLRERLASYTLSELEAIGNPALSLFKETGGPRLAIPQEYGGMVLSAADACRVQAALGAISPSLAVATTMHHFSVATLAELAADSNGLEGLALEAVAEDNLLVASGFAEGRADGSLLRPFVELTGDRQSGFRLSGAKKPCSLSKSMDLITLSVLAPTHDGALQMAVILLPAASPGISVRPFWKSPILGGAESDEVVLDHVEVSEQLISYSGEPERLDRGQVAGFVWFEMLITSAYVGIASGLAARAIGEQRGAVSDRTRISVELTGAMAALEGLAADVDAGDRSESLLARALLIRYAAQQAIERATMLSAELLGGMAFIGGKDVAYLLAAGRALAFHPPSRTAMSAPLAEYLSGSPLVMERAARSTAVSGARS